MAAEYEVAYAGGARLRMGFDTATAPEPAPRTARPRPATAKRHITTTVRHLGAILLVASETGRPLGLDLFRPNTPRASTKKAHRPTLAKG